MITKVRHDVDDTASQCYGNSPGVPTHVQSPRQPAAYQQLMQFQGCTIWPSSGKLSNPSSPLHRPQSQESQSNLVKQYLQSKPNLVKWYLWKIVYVIANKSRKKVFSFNSMVFVIAIKFRLVFVSTIPSKSEVIGRCGGDENAKK